MSISRILGRPGRTTLSYFLAGRHPTAVKALGSDSEARQQALLMDYYLMCDVDERHQTIRANSKEKDRRELRQYHRKQDIDNRILEARLLKSSAK
jgi:hypothetical protein